MDFQIEIWDTLLLAVISMLLTVIVGFFHTQRADQKEFMRDLKESLKSIVSKDECAERRKVCSPRIVIPKLEKRGECIAKKLAHHYHTGLPEDSAVIFRGEDL